MKNLLAAADWSFGISGLDFACSDENLSFRKQVIYEGSHPYKDDSFDVDEDLIDHWVDTNTGLLSEGVEIPLPPYHTNDTNVSQGSITKFEKGFDSKGRISLFLSGVAKTKKILDKLRTTDISLFSPAVAKIGKRFVARPILHACTTDRPVIKGMDRFELALSYNGAFEMAETTKGQAGTNTGGKVRKRIKQLRSLGWTLVAIGNAVDRDESTLSAIVSGEISNPPSSLLRSLNKLKAKPMTAKMAEDGGAYCTHCGSKKGQGMHGDSMHGDSMHGDSMHGDQRKLSPTEAASQILEMEGDQMPEMAKSFMEKMAGRKRNEHRDEDHGDHGDHRNDDDGQSRRGDGDHRRRRNDRKSRRLLSLSLSNIEKDDAIDSMARACSERVALVNHDDGLLILAESELTEDFEPYAIVDLGLSDS